MAKLVLLSLRSGNLLAEGRHGLLLRHRVGSSLGVVLYFRFTSVSAVELCTYWAHLGRPTHAWPFRAAYSTCQNKSKAYIFTAG